MSALLFGSRAAAHVDGVTPKADPNAIRGLAAEGGEPPPQPTPRDKLVTIVAGLIPADILAAHLILLQGTTKVNENPPPGLEKPVIEITDKGALEAGFIALIILSLVFYAVGRYRAGGKFNPVRDIGLALVPALAFVAWTALQRATAFDAINADAGDRTVWGLVTALLAIALSTAFTGKTEKPA